MRSELQTLFWLQWKLTRSMFRGRRVADRLRLLMLLSRLAMFLFSIPTSVLIGCGLAVGMILLSPEAAHELATLTNVCIFFIWLSLPASYNSQLAERFEMSRLFAYPIRFRSIVVGSTLMSLLTITGMWTALILLGEIVGMAWHQPLALPLILIGAVPTFALLVLTGRIMAISSTWWRATVACERWYSVCSLCLLCCVGLDSTRSNMPLTVSVAHPGSPGFHSCRGSNR